MKKLHLITGTALLLFAFACNSRKSDNEKLKEELKAELKEEMAREAENKEKKESEVEKTPDYTINNFVLKSYSPEMAAQVDYKGKVLKGKAWQDANGKNFVIFTEEFDKEKADKNGIKDIFLYAYHFADKGTGYKQLRMIKDWEKECDLINHAEFRFKTLNITDLDMDNKAEITFIYRLGCNMDPTPVPMKLMMLEDGDKYAIRGKTSIKRMNIEGEMNVDASFNDAPMQFLKFAKDIWELDKEYFSDQIAREEFKAFWKKFQNIIANDDKAAFMRLCTEEYKKNFGDHYPRFIDAQAKEEIAKATIDDMRSQNPNNRLFAYLDDESDSLCGFFFKKINGEWKVQALHFAG